jgi:hypothetical protein
VVRHGDRARLRAWLEARGWAVDRDMLVAMEGERFAFRHPETGLDLDVFVERLQFCHTIELESRWSRHRTTLPIEDLLLQKLQIHDPKPADAIDTAIVLATHDVGAGGDGIYDAERIDGEYVAAVLARDWGFHRDATANLERLASARPERVIWIDMEGSRWTDATIEAFRKLRARHDNVGLCLQAYLRRTPSDVLSLLPLKPRIRLVKGAYEEPRALALQSRAEVDGAYRQLALKLLEETGGGLPPPTLASHDVKLLRRIIAESGAHDDAFEIAMLYGIRSADLQSLVDEGKHCTVLISYGTEWAAWYLRRLAERPANLVFALTAIVRR